jgi:Skp family chaperone for outer membrane proteins
MRRYCPPFLLALPGLVRQYPWLMLGVMILGAVFAWKAFAPAIPRAARVATAAVPTLRPTVTTRDPLEKQMDDLRDENKAEHKAREALTKALKALEQKAEADTKAREEERAQAAQRLAQQQQQFEATLQQVRTATARERSATRSTPTPAVKLGTSTPVVVPSAPVGPMFELRTLRPEVRSGASRPLPPLANQDETAYLAAGCLAEVTVVTGVMATSQLGGETWGHPVLFNVATAFHCPWRLGGPGQRPRPSGIELAGCFALGKAKADMSSSRAIIAVELLSCVFPDGSSYEVPIKGYAVDQDGTLGIVGELHTHDSAKLAKAFLTGLIQEASAAFGLAKSQLVITGTSGPQPFQGAQTTLQQVANFWLEQARALLPTLWVRSKTPAYLVLLEGLPLQGYPVVALVGRP